MTRLTGIIGNPPVVLSFGDLVLDLVFSIPELPVRAGVDQISSRVQTEPGGAGSFLIAGQRLGLRMVAAGAVGDDIFGRAVLDFLSTEGVDVSGALRPPGSVTTTVLVLVDRAGQHVFLGQPGTGPDIPLTPAWQSAVLQADAVHFWGYSFHERHLAGAVLAAAELAHSHRKPIVFDPGPLIGGAPPDETAHMLSLATAVLLTGEELALVTGGLDEEAGARSLLGQGVRVVVVKAGARGCTLYTAGQRAHQPAFPVEVSDTTAAGDCFAAGFTSGYLRGWPLEQVLILASAAGAAAVKKLGSGRQVPTRDEVQHIINQFDLDLDF